MAESLMQNVLDKRLSNTTKHVTPSSPVGDHGRGGMLW